MYWNIELQWNKNNKKSTQNNSKRRSIVEDQSPSKSIWISAKNFVWTFLVIWRQKLALIRLINGWMLPVCVQESLEKKSCYLQKKQIEQRVRWAELFASTSDSFWDTVVFSDEMKNQFVQQLFSQNQSLETRRWVIASRVHQKTSKTPTIVDGLGARSPLQMLVLFISLMDEWMVR